MIVQLGNMSKESSLKINAGEGESAAGWVTGQCPLEGIQRPSHAPSIPPLRCLEAAKVFLHHSVLSHSQNPILKGLPAPPRKGN